MNVVVFGPVSLVEEECADSGGLTEVEEELRKNVNGQQPIRRNMEVRKPHNHEQHRQNHKPTQLDRLPPNRINRRNTNPIPRHRTTQHDDHVPDSRIVQKLIHIVGVLARVPNDLQNRAVVQAHTIEGHVETEPRARGAEEQEEVLALAVMPGEVTPAGFRDFEVLAGGGAVGRPGDFVGMAFAFAGYVGFDVVVGLFDVAGDVKGVAGGFRDGETVWVELATYMYLTLQGYWRNERTV